MMAAKAPQRIYDEYEYYQAVVVLFEDNLDEETKFLLPLAKGIAEDQRRTIECIENGEPIVSSSIAAGVEILAAMDLHWFFFAQPPVTGLSPYLIEDSEGRDKLDIPTDICSLMRIGYYELVAGYLPRPTCSIALITPCDASSLTEEAMRVSKQWRGSPMFALDAPIYWDDRAVDYYADLLREEVTFLEKHTGKKLDMDKLRNVMEETNKVYELWLEYNETRRAVPCPHGSFSASTYLAASQLVASMIGKPEACAFLKDQLDDAEERVRAGRGWLENERVRVIWADLRPVWFLPLVQFLERECGAIIVMDWYGDCYPFQIVDTSTEDSMFKGLAKRCIFGATMVRQVRSSLDVVYSDIVRAVKDYKLDVVIHPLHVGHKDQAASLAVVRDACRELGVAYLPLGCDLWDPRYVGIDEIKNKIWKLFSTMGF